MCNLQTRYAMHKASVPIVWCMRSVQLNGNESHSDSVATSLRESRNFEQTQKNHTKMETYGPELHTHIGCTFEWKCLHTFHFRAHWRIVSLLCAVDPFVFVIVIHLAFDIQFSMRRKLKRPPPPPSLPLPFTLSLRLFVLSFFLTR